MRRQNKVAQYIATWPILDLFEQSAHRLGGRVPWRWWEQEVLDLEGVNNRKATAAESDGEEIIGKEEGMPLETATGRELGWGYKVAT